MVERHLIMKDGKIGFKNSDTASATPQSGFSSMYVNGEKRLYFMADDGVAYDVLLNSMAELNDLLDVESLQIIFDDARDLNIVE